MRAGKISSKEELILNRREINKIADAASKITGCEIQKINAALTDDKLRDIFK